MIYAYKCNQCDLMVDSTIRDDSLGPCTECPGELRRKFIIRMDRVMQAHFNPTLGKEVSSLRTFDNEMRRESEIRSNELGMEHRFERVDPSDKEALGVTDEGIDASNRIRRAKGLPTFKA